MSTEKGLEIDDEDGAHPEVAVSADESDTVGGFLRMLTATWEDVQRTRLAASQRRIPSDGMKLIEDRYARQIRRELEAHVLWPWLRQYPGLGGVHTARLIALIDDPHRFPGRVCEARAGHHHSAIDAFGEIDHPFGCGTELTDGTVCAAPVGPVRRGTGTRALWHYLGLHVVNGRSPRKVKGQRADWNPIGRTVVLMPGGLADQIVRQRVPKYRDIYDATKERLTAERAVLLSENERSDGPLPVAQAEVEGPRVIEATAGLRPFQVDAIARKVAAKAFVADLLQAWKRVA